MSANQDVIIKFKQLEQDLISLHENSAKLFPNDPDWQAKIFFEKAVLKIKELFDQIPNSSQADFFQYLQKQFNLQNNFDPADFLRRAPEQTKNLANQAFNNHL